MASLDHVPPSNREAGSAAAGELLDVRDVVPRVAVQRLLQAQLVQVVADEADGAAEHEEPVQAAEAHQLVALLPREGATGPDHVYEGDGDAAVDVQDKVGALPRRDLLHRQREVQDRSRLEVLLRVLLDQDHALVRVGQGLDAVPDAHDELVVLLAPVDEVLRGDAAVVCLAEHLRGVVQRPAEARADGEQAAAEGRHQVLARARGHDGVVRAADGGAVVAGDHEDHLDELGARGGQLAAEPQQRQDAADAQVLGEDLGDRHAAVLQLLAAVVRNGGDEVGRLAHHAELLGPRVVHGHLGSLALWRLYDHALQNEVLVHLGDQLRQLVEGVGDVDARLLHGLVLGGRRLHVAAGLGAGVAELHLRGEARSARAHAPCDDWLGDAAVLDRVNEVVLIDPADLA
mmetsp:Transcript_45424/g.117920  ORF Transcript_45424/g.117920 Transcript_45424/m.117920 type:complete len:402 (+) Transcript_45424:268-1473(+)